MTPALDAMGDLMRRKALTDHLATLRADIADMDARALSLCDQLEAVHSRRREALGKVEELKARLGSL